MKISIFKFQWIFCVIRIFLPFISYNDLKVNIPLKRYRHIQFFNSIELELKNTNFCSTMVNVSAEKVLEDAGATSVRPTSGATQRLSACVSAQVKYCRTHIIELTISACNCNIYGSATMQCHRGNGSCVCTSGIGGDKCDQCDRGFLGQAPYCSPCGECFDNWDRTLDGLRG